VHVDVPASHSETTAVPSLHTSCAALGAGVVVDGVVAGVVEVDEVVVPVVVDMDVVV
jgi:hypothetical protein